MINPYSGVNWNDTLRVNSSTHLHVENDEQLMLAYNGGIRHFPISNYYPSSPAYPLSEHFSTIPEGVLGAPNAEHHHFLGLTPSVHINSVGSFFSSGKEIGEEPRGIQKTWQKGFDEIIEALQFPNGGGITINHPSWSRDNGTLTTETIFNMLDYHEAVLGIEIYNDSGNYDPNTATLPEETQRDLNLWDSILSTGRRCWGFTVSDHGHKYRDPWFGMMTLLLDEFTEEKALTAYRIGAFYGRLIGEGLEFTDIKYTPNEVKAITDTNCTLRVIVNGNIVRQVANTNEITYNPKSSDVYVRIEAEQGGEKLFAQPFMLKTPREILLHKRKRILLVI